MQRYVATTFYDGSATLEIGDLPRPAKIEMVRADDHDAELARRKEAEAEVERLRNVLSGWDKRIFELEAELSAKREALVRIRDWAGSHTTSIPDNNPSGFSAIYNEAKTAID